MIFHGYFRSSSAYRCRIAFNLKGLKPDLKSVHLRRDGGQQKAESYRALNPQALVPALEMDDMVLTQSLAIIEWLDETNPEPALLPKTADLRAKARAFSQVIACDTHPLQNLRVLDYLKEEFRQDQTGLDRCASAGSVTVWPRAKLYYNEIRPLEISVLVKRRGLPIFVSFHNSSQRTAFT